MFQIQRIGSRITRRSTTALLIAGLCFGASVGPVSAQSFAGSGQIGAHVSCSIGTRTATVNVNVTSLGNYNSTGLNFYVELWAKARSKSWGSTPLATARTTSAIKTQIVANNSGYSYLTNRTVTLLSTSFRSTLSYTDTFDIFVRYWYAAPRATSWTGYFQFEPGRDPHSSISQLSWAGSPFVTRCSL